MYTTPPPKFGLVKNKQVPQTLLYPIILVSRKRIAKKKHPNKNYPRNIDPMFHRVVLKQGLGFGDLWNFNFDSWKGGVTAITCDKDLGNLTVSWHKPRNLGWLWKGFMDFGGLVVYKRGVWTPQKTFYQTISAPWTNMNTLTVYIFMQSFAASTINFAEDYRRSHVDCRSLGWLKLTLHFVFSQQSVRSTKCRRVLSPWPQPLGGSWPQTGESVSFAQWPPFSFCPWTSPSLLWP